MIILLNGPLGVGKSTLAEALAERIEGCVMLDGDALVAVHPPPRDEREHLHETLSLLVAHHRQFGYRHFVIDHVWTAPEEIRELRDRLRTVAPGDEFRCFRLTLPGPENLARIERRAGARAIDEREFELRTVAAERAALESDPDGGLGEPFDVSAAPGDLADEMLRRLGMR